MVYDDVQIKSVKYSHISMRRTIFAALLIRLDMITLNYLRRDENYASQHAQDLWLFIVKRQNHLLHGSASNVCKDGSVCQWQ
jgi:hypothetical protein